MVDESALDANHGAAVMYIFLSLSSSKHFLCFVVFQSVCQFVFGPLFPLFLLTYLLSAPALSYWYTAAVVTLASSHSHHFGGWWRILSTHLPLYWHDCRESTDFLLFVISSLFCVWCVSIPGKGKRRCSFVTYDSVRKAWFHLDSFLFRPCPFDGSMMCNFHTRLPSLLIRRLFCAGDRFI